MAAGCEMSDRTRPESVFSLRIPAQRIDVIYFSFLEMEKDDRVVSIY